MNDCRRKEDPLQTHDERFGLFMGHLPGTAFIKDRDGTYLHVNETLLCVLGGQASDWVGKKDPECCRRTSSSSLVQLTGGGRWLQVLSDAWMFSPAEKGCEMAPGRKSVFLG